MTKRTHLFITISIFMLTTVGSSIWFMSPPIVTKGDTEKPISLPDIMEQEKGRRVVIHLDTMTLELLDNKTVIATLPLLSQGKPGSYYETIGGSYINDYKTPLHFSSIGHVYMPYSVHLFGNYFIHGIPYYPNGNPVSSTYSGGCIRLTDENAKLVYDFVTRGTPIIITRGDEDAFSSTKKASTTLFTQEMTVLMTATISLEALTQDNTIIDTDEVTETTRRKTLPRLINDNDIAVAQLYTKSIGNDMFVQMMNDKAKALGLTNTYFTDVYSPVPTTFEDYLRFTEYINTYKSYLRTLQKESSTTESGI